MKTEIKVWNGSGWNHYKGLEVGNSMFEGKLTALKSLLRKNKIAELTVAPSDSEKPFGISARYYDVSGEQSFNQGFDQNDSAEYICARVFALLDEGIENRIIRNRERARAEALAAARAAGFETAQAHADFLTKKEEEARVARAAFKAAEDAANLAECETTFQALVSFLKSNPDAERLTRGGQVITDSADFIDRLNAGRAEKIVGCIKFDFVFPPGQMRAWLKKHGYQPTVDERKNLFNSAKHQ